MELTGGPDAARYIAAAQGIPVPQPFHLRWLLPFACGTSARAWWTVWLASWPVLAAAMFGWRLVAGDAWGVALAATVLLLSLPGILGPSAVIPVGVDLPATALGVVSVLLIESGHPGHVAAAVIIVSIAATIRETTPVWAALWVWSPWLLLGLVPVLVRHLIAKRGPDPLGARFDEIAAHPIRASLAAHRGRWRDAWLMVAPWGVCLVALIGADWRLIIVLAVAYGQLLIATDTVRLVHHGAGVPMAVAAASVIPAGWLVLACVVHVVWWRSPERV